MKSIPLCALFVVVPLAIWPELYHYELIPKLLAYNVALIAVVLACPPRAPQLPITLCGIGLCAMLVVYWVGGSLPGAFDVGYLASLAALAMVVSRSRALMMPVWWSAALTGGFLACMGIVQYFGGAVPYIDQAAPPAATFANRNLLAEYLICCIPVGVWLYWRSFSRRELLASGIPTALMGVCLVYTRCRAAWLGMAVGLVILWLAIRVMPPKSLWWCKVFPNGSEQFIDLREFKFRLWVALVSVFLVGSAIPGDLSSPKIKQNPVEAIVGGVGQDVSVSDRMKLWANTSRIVVAHPLGVGPGNWARAYAQVAPGETYFQNPHNDYLWIASEYGLAGLVVWIGVLGLAIRKLWARKDHGRFFCAALAAISIAAFFGFPKEQPDTMMWGMAFIGASWWDNAPT